MTLTLTLWACENDFDTFTSDFQSLTIKFWRDTAFALLPFWQIWGGWDLAQRFYWTHSSFILDLMTSLQMNTPNKLHQKLNLPVDKLWKKYILCSNLRYQDNLVGILLLTDRLCEKSIYWDYTSVYLFFSGLWQCWKTKWDRDFFSSFSFQDDLNNHCNALSYLTIVFQADFRECSAGFTGKSELSACDIITVSWPCRNVEWRKFEPGNLVKLAMLLFIIWNVVDSLFIVQNVINVCGKSWTTCYGHKEVVNWKKKISNF